MGSWPDCGIAAIKKTAAVQISLIQRDTCTAAVQDGYIVKCSLVRAVPIWPKVVII